MSIRIDQERCIGCMRCAEVCPGNLIWKKGEKALIRIPEDCWGCTSCMKACPTGAIRFFLGADIGGMGSCMTYRKKDHISEWTITSKSGETRTIRVDDMSSNQY